MLSSSAWLTDVTTPSWRALPAMLRSYWLLRFEGLSRAPQGWWFKSSLRQQCGSGHGVWMEARRLVQISRRENWSESLFEAERGMQREKVSSWEPKWGPSLESLSCRIPSARFLLRAFASLLWLCCVRAWARLRVSWALLRSTPQLFSCPSPLSPSWAWKGEEEEGERERAGPGITPRWRWSCW